MIYITFDTSYIISTHFNFNSSFFNHIREYIQEKRVKIILSSIVDREIEKHLINETKDSLNAMNKASKRVQCLIDNKAFPAFLEENEAVNLSKKIYQKFKKSFSIEVIDIGNVDSEKIFTDYFDETGAFSSKEKKKEFPDAFAIDSLINYIKDNKLLLLSNDFDWENHIIHRGGCLITAYEKIIKKSNCIISKSHEPVLSYLASITEKENDDCRKYYNDKFEQLFADLLNKEFILQLEDFRYCYDDIDVLDLGIKSILFKDAMIIKKEEEKNKLNVAILYEIESYQEVEYDDYDNGCWDSEEKDYAYVPHIKSTLYYKTDGFVEVECSYKYEDGKLSLSNTILEYNEISLQDDDLIAEELDFDDYDYDFYEEEKLIAFEENKKKSIKR